MDIEPFGPFQHSESFAIKSQLNCFSLVACLFNIRRPPAVFRSVTEIVVDAVNAVLIRWRFAHIGIEGFKGLSPLFAHRNAATAIVNIGRLIRICTASNHATPNGVDASMFHAMRASVVTEQFILETTARFGIARSQSSSLDQAFCAAIATAEPEQTSSFAWMLSDAMQDNPSTESLTRYIYSFGRGRGILRMHKKFTFLLPSPGTLARRLGTFIVGLNYSTNERFGQSSPC